jgi:RsiW-degrading membrane proteinase PrsW (M82 family)
VDGRLDLALLGAVPAILAMFVFDWLDRRRPEPRAVLRMTAMAGAIAIIPVLAIELMLDRMPVPEGSFADAAYHGFVIAALPEEVAKFACLWVVVWRRPEFDERLDGIVYAAHAGLGFALVENVGYLFNATSIEQWWHVFVARAVLAVPGHAIFAAVIGYYAARRRFDRTGPGALGGLALAWAMHGVYDTALLAMPIATDREWLGLSAALAGIAVMVIVGGALVVRDMARRALAADDLAEALEARTSRTGPGAA